MTKKLSHTHIMILLLLIGILARAWMLGSIPGGINQDEAFGAYEAYSLLHHGMDSSGYSFPVYLNARGNGMNALNSYLMMPFIALFGFHTWVVRLPQFLVSCFTLLVFYKLLAKLFSQKAACLGLLFLSVCPWHIMLARWGLESNLAPGFLLFGFYFFLLGVEDSRFFWLSSLFYGCSLYCYAVLWPIVPLMLALQLLYLFYTRAWKFDFHAAAAGILLFLLALPLILFLLINAGYLPEIRTPFLSVPRMVEIRSSEISFQNIPWNLKNLIRMLLKQNDGLYWNSTEQFGLYYKGTLLFAGIGFCYCVKRLWDSVQKRAYDGVVLLLVPFLCAVFLGCLIEVNVNRINCIHLPIILFLVIGLYQTLNFLQKYLKYIWHCAVGLLLACFLCFEIFYFTDYKEQIGILFQEGLGDSVAYAMSLAKESGETKEIYVAADFNHSKILYYSRIPVTEYLEQIQYAEEHTSFLVPLSCGPFHFQYAKIPDGQIAIISEDAVPDFEAAGWQVQQFGHTAVAY